MCEVSGSWGTEDELPRWPPLPSSFAYFWVSRMWRGEGVGDLVILQCGIHLCCLIHLLPTTARTSKRRLFTGLSVIFLMPWRKMVKKHHKAIQWGYTGGICWAHSDCWWSLARTLSHLSQGECVPSNLNPTFPKGARNGNLTRAFSACLLLASLPSKVPLSGEATRYRWEGKPWTIFPSKKYKISVAMMRCVPTVLQLFCSS